MKSRSDRVPAWVELALAMAPVLLVVVGCAVALGVWILVEGAV